MSALSSSKVTVLCCLCGTPTTNSSAQCDSCLSSQFDLSSLLNNNRGSDLLVSRCKRCLRYKTSPITRRYEAMEPESGELMALCLKSIPAIADNHGRSNDALTGVSSIELVDSSWVWTEPHSKRIKLRLTVKARLSAADVVIQQRVMVTFKEKNSQCPECDREFTNRTWEAIVQVRERREEGTLGNMGRMERAIAENRDVRRRVVNIELSKNGFDFYFLSPSYASSFTSFLSRILPTRIKHTQKLVSADSHSNTANIKHTYSCDIVPLEKNDLIVCDKKAGGGMGVLKGRLCLCTKVSSNVRIVSTNPARDAKEEDVTTDIPQDAYWRNEKHFRVLLTARRMAEFYVIDVEVCTPGGTVKDGEEADFILADVMVQRANDYGVNDEFLSCVTTLGHLLEVGDLVVGYDLTTTQVAEEEWGEVFVHSFEMPDVVIVRKEKSGGASELVEGGEGEKGKDERNKGKKKKKSRRQKKKELNEKVKEQNGRGYRGAKTQSSFEDKLDRMGFLDDEKERRQWADADGDEDEEFFEAVVEAENILGSEPVQQAE